jgi:hypothetical protein
LDYSRQSKEGFFSSRTIMSNEKETIDSTQGSRFNERRFKIADIENNRLGLSTR